MYRVKPAPLANGAKYRWVNNHPDMFDARMVDKNSKDYDLLVVPNCRWDVYPAHYGDDSLKLEKVNYSKVVDLQFMSGIAQAARDKKKIIGVGYGAKLLCIAAGGCIIQEAHGHRMITKGEVNHRFCHDIFTMEGDNISVPSTHVSMMYPFNLRPQDYAVLAWAYGQSEVPTGKSKTPAPNIRNSHQYLDLPTEEEYMGENIEKTYENNSLEPEVVYFRHLDALAIEFDPHIINHEENPEALHYFFEVVDKFLNDKL